MSEIRHLRSVYKRIAISTVFLVSVAIAATLPGAVSEAATAQAITSADVAVGALGSPFTFTVTTSGSPVPTIAETGSLPSGLSFVDNGNGTATISGTSSDAGVTYLIITATFGAGSTGQYVASQAFTLALPSSVTVLPQYLTRSCYGDQDTLVWPASNAADLTGYEVELAQPDPDPPSYQYEKVGAQTTYLSFSLTPQLLQLTVYPIISGTASSTPLGSTSIVGSKGPSQMLWNGQGESVGKRSATVQLGWSEEMSTYFNTGGQTDNFVMTDSPGGTSETPTVTYPSASATFKGLTPGVAYTFTLSISDACDPTGVSTQTPTFTPGIAPTLSGTPPTRATVGNPYRFAFTAGGDPTPKETVTSGSLPPGLHLSRAGVISGTPTTAGTYSVTITSANGVGVQTSEPPPVTDSFTIKVKG
jgi:large repetitive protein